MLLIASKLLEPDGADDVVFCYSELGCSLSNELDSSSIRNCCLGQGQSFAPSDETCVPCVGKNNQ